MGGSLSLSEGTAVVELAREVVTVFLKSKKRVEADLSGDIFEEKRGVFVTINNKYGDLRGCIGLPYPIKSLSSAVVDAALSAALEDPRFPDVSYEELNDLLFEVSVLTVPELLRGDRRDFPKLVEVGRDGLIVKRGSRSGLLLPQVPVEWKWSSEEFLSHCCEKAGLPVASWKELSTEVFVFEAQVFKEEKKGKVVEEELSG